MRPGRIPRINVDTLPEWRRRAWQLFPYLREDLIDDDFSIYMIFFDLRDRCLKAHAGNSDHELRKIYDYAGWCLHQEEKDLWNAAGVAFYEHLVDDPITRDAIPKWVPLEVFEEVRGLFECRMEPGDFARLEEAYIEASCNKQEPGA